MLEPKHGFARDQPIDESRRAQAEPAELERAQQLLTDWLQQSELPVVEALRHNPSPRLLVLGGGGAALGHQLANTIKSSAAVEQIPHGQYLNETELRESAQVAAAFVDQPDVICLPFTIDHLKRLSKVSFQSVSMALLQSTIIELWRSSHPSITIVTSHDTVYPRIFKLLGLHAVQDQTLAEPHSPPDDAAHLTVFVKGEAVLDQATAETINQCDCMLANIVTVLGSGMMELYLDDLGIQANALDDFRRNYNDFQQSERRIAERYQRLQMALPKLAQHPDARVRELGQHFAAAAEQFPELLQLIQPVAAAAETLMQEAEAGTNSPAVKAAIQVVETASFDVLAWFDRTKPIAQPIGQSLIYQAYRTITLETDRQEFPKR